MSGKWIEQWGVLEHIAAYKKAQEHKDQLAALEQLRKSAQTGKSVLFRGNFTLIADSETGRRELRQTGVFHVMKTLLVGEIGIGDLHIIRYIFDEVYERRIPAKLAYKDVQPLLSPILGGSNRVDCEYAHAFLLDYTDLLPVPVRSFQQQNQESSAIFTSFLPKPESNRIIAAYRDGKIQIYNVRRNEKDFSLPHSGMIKSFACSGDGQYVAYTSTNGRVYVWAVKEDARSASWDAPFSKGTLGPVAFKSDGSLIVSTFENHTESNPSSHPEPPSGQTLDLVLYHIDSGKWRLNSGTHSVIDALPTKYPLPPDAQESLNASHLQLWAGDGQQLHSRISTDLPSCVAFSRNRCLVALGEGRGSGSGNSSASNSDIVNIFQRSTTTDSFQHLRTLQGDKDSKGSIKALSFSPDGKHLVSGGSDNRIRVWDTKGWSEMVNFGGHNGDVNSVAISDTDDYLVSCSDDGTVRVWDAKALLTGPNLDEQKHDPTATAN
ncbi:hypothetical protein EIP86_005964 [Pleurotus ostreatoroseus]|nr:hypothetical protein EIP86_005964 [Pleurotus ostreatoroseus]